MDTDVVALVGLVVAVLGAILSIASLWLAAAALRRGNKNASAALVVSINENFRQGWARVLSAKGDARAFELHELLNLIETTCAIQQERSITGVSRELIEEYLCQVLAILGKDQQARRAIAGMRNAPTSFKYLRAFFREMRLAGKALPLEKVSTGEASPSEPPPPLAEPLVEIAPLPAPVGPPAVGQVAPPIVPGKSRPKRKRTVPKSKSA